MKKGVVMNVKTLCIFSLFCLLLAGCASSGTADPIEPSIQVRGQYDVSIGVVR